MRAVPIKLTTFRKTDSVYVVGVDGVFANDTNPVHAATVILKRIMQIKAYCDKYSKPIVVLVNSSRVPKYLHTALRALRVRIISVVDKDSDAKYGDYYQVEDPLAFIGKHSNVAIMLFAEPKEGVEQDNDVDFGEGVDTPVVTLIYNRMKDNGSAFFNPNEVVKAFPQRKPTNNDPYAAFYHEPLFRTVPYNYWQELMDTMPEVPQGNGTPNNVY